jgi:hypothetical protein
MAGEPVDFAVLPVAAVAGMIAMVALVCVAPWDEIAGLAAVIAASLALYGVARVSARRGEMT